MKFKTPLAYEQFHSDKLNDNLRKVVQWVDHLCALMQVDCEVTSVYREGDPGVHGFWRGVDLSVRSWPEGVAELFETLINMRWPYGFRSDGKPGVTALYHENRGAPGMHMHLQSRP